MESILMRARLIAEISSGTWECEGTWGLLVAATVRWVRKWNENEPLTDNWAWLPTLVLCGYVTNTYDEENYYHSQRCSSKNMEELERIARGTHFDRSRCCKMIAMWDRALRAACCRCRIMGNNKSLVEKSYVSSTSCRVYRIWRAACRSIVISNIWASYNKGFYV